MAIVVAIGTLDTKGAEYGFLRDRLLEHGVDVILVDAGVLGEPAIAAVEVRKDVIVLCHGGPIAEPDDAANVLERTTGVAGFFGASSMERLPTEIAMTETARRFKSLKPSPTA